MSKEPLLVSFYQDTDGTDGYYEREALRLKSECDALNQPCSILKRDYGDDYLSIVRGKPTFMLEMLNRHKGRDIVFVDVDTVLRQKLDYRLDKIGWALKANGRPLGHVHYLPNTAETKAFLKAWIETLTDWEGGDHSALWLTVQQTGIEWLELQNIGPRLGIGYSQHHTQESKEAFEYLESIDWMGTVQKRLQ